MNLTDPYPPLPPPSLSHSDLKACGELCDMARHETAYGAVRRVVEQRNTLQRMVLANSDITEKLADMTRQRDNWIEVVAEKTREINELKRQLTEMQDDTSSNHDTKMDRDYRILDIGEILQEGDEVSLHGRWYPVMAYYFGKKCKISGVRRPLFK